MSQEPENLRNLLSQAEHCMEANDFPVARDIYKQVLDIESDNAAAIAGLQEAEIKIRQVAEIQDLVAEADGEADAGRYGPAVTLYERAWAMAAQAHILQPIASIERKRDETRERDRWGKRLKAVRQQVRRLGRAGQWGEAREVLDPLLAELRGTRHEDLATQVETMRAEAVANLDADKLLQQAREAFASEDFELAMELAASVEKDANNYNRAQEMYKNARRQHDLYIQPEMEQAEEAYDDGRLDDAQAILSRLKDQYPANSTWQRLWLRVFMQHGRNLLDQGRQANGERRFREAGRSFRGGRQALERVLEVYPEHPTAVPLCTEARELRAIAVHEERALAAWEAEPQRLEEAYGALKQAQGILDQAKAEEREYLAVEAMVNSMLGACEVKRKDLDEQRAAVAEGELLLSEKRLWEAEEAFRGALDAEEEKTARRAQNGWSQVQALQRTFEDDVQQGQETLEAGQPGEAVGAFQAAHDRWPSGPNMPRLLVEALIAAAREARESGNEKAAKEYAVQVFDYDPGHAEAQRILSYLEARPLVAELVAGVPGQLARIEGGEAMAPEDYAPILGRLQGVWQTVQGRHPDLENQLRPVMEEVQKRQRRWTAYAGPAEQAERLRGQGDWEGALREFGKAIDALGDLPAEGPRGQLLVWQQVADALAFERERAQKGLEAAKSTYEAAPESGDWEAPFAGLVQVEQALRAARQACEDLLPADLIALERQAQNLRGGAEVAREAAGMVEADLPGAVDKLEDALEMRRADAVLARLQAQLNEQLEREKDARAAALRADAALAAEAGQITEALDLLRKARGLRDSAEIRAELGRLEGRAELERKLREIWLDVEQKLATNSRKAALVSLEAGVLLLMDRDAGLPTEVRSLANRLLQLQTDLHVDATWEEARQFLAQIGEAGLADPSVARLRQWVNEWAQLGRRVAQERIIDSAVALNMLEEGYKAAFDAVSEDPYDEELVHKEAEMREHLVSRLDESAHKRVERAREALEAGSYSVALQNLVEIERDIYSPADEQFPELLRGHTEAEDVRQEAAHLQAQAEELAKIYEKVAPLVAQAREAYTNDEHETAEKLLNQIRLEDPQGRARLLHQEAEDLRAAVGDQRKEQSAIRLRAALQRAETQLPLASTAEDYQRIQAELAALDLSLLDETDRQQRLAMMDRAKAALEQFEASQLWMDEARELMDAKDYEAAVAALEEVQPANAREKVQWQKLLREATQQRDHIRHQQSIREQGQALLVRGEYRQAREVLAQGAAAGVEVGGLLDAARAGVMLAQGKEDLNRGEYGQALANLEQAQKMSEGTAAAREIAAEAGRLLEQAQKLSQRSTALSIALSEARGALRLGQYDAAESKVQDVLRQDSKNKEAETLLQEIGDARQAQHMLDEARERMHADDPDSAESLVRAVLTTLVADHPEAVVLLGQITSQKETGQALARAELLADKYDFVKAEQAIQEAYDLNPRHPRLREVQKVVRDKRQAWQDEALRPAREAKRDDRFDEALDICRLALMRSDDPDFTAQVHSLQQEVVDRWTDRELREAESRLAQAKGVDDLARLADDLERVPDREPKPSVRLLGQVEEIQRHVHQKRLDLLLDEAQRLAADHKYDSALRLCQAVDEEALDLGLGGITTRALSVLMEIENARDEFHRLQEAQAEEADQRLRQERLEAARETLAAPGQLEDLEHAYRLAEQVLDMPRFHQDPEASSLRDNAQQQIDLYHASRRAQDQARRRLREDRFADALKELDLPAVSPLLQQDYLQVQKVAGLLVNADRAYDHGAWEAAFQHYSQAAELEPGLQLGDHLERCQSRLMEQVLDRAQQLLQALNPAQAARVLDQARDKGWVTPATQAEVERLRDRIDQLTHVAQSAQLFREGRPAAEILAVLDQARQAAPEGRLDADAANWWHLALALQAWERQEIDVAGRELRLVEPPVSDEPRAQELGERLAVRRAVEGELSDLRAATKTALDQDPPDYDGAIDRARAGLELAPDHAVARRIHADVRARLVSDLTSARRAGRYTEALSYGQGLRRLAPDDAELQADVAGLEQERQERLKDTIQQARGALEDFDLDGARAALHQGEVIAAPDGDARLEELAGQLAELEGILKGVDGVVAEVDRALAEGDLELAVDRTLQARKEAPYYGPAIEAGGRVVQRLAESIQVLLTREQFVEALDECDLALRLGPSEEIGQLRQRVLAAQDRVVADMRQMADQALKDFDPEGAEAAVRRGLAGRPDDRALHKLELALEDQQCSVGQVQAAMRRGWKRLQAKDPGGALAHFQELLDGVPGFAEAARWQAYARSLQEGLDLMNTQDFGPAAQRFRAAEELLRIRADERLTPILGGQARLREERRQAVFEAGRLAREAEALDALEDQVEKLKREEKWERAAILVAELGERVDEFPEFLTTVVAPPDGFDAEAGAPPEDLGGDRAEATRTKPKEPGRQPEPEPQPVAPELEPPEAEPQGLAEVPTPSFHEPEVDTDTGAEVAELPDTEAIPSPPPPGPEVESEPEPSREPTDRLEEVEQGETMDVEPEPETEPSRVSETARDGGAPEEAGDPEPELQPELTAAGAVPGGEAGTQPGAETATSSPMPEPDAEPMTSPDAADEAETIVSENAGLADAVELEEPGEGPDDSTAGRPDPETEPPPPMPYGAIMGGVTLSPLDEEEGKDSHG